MEKLLERVVLNNETFPDKDFVWEKIVCRIEQLDTIKQPLKHRHKKRIIMYWSIAVSIAAVLCLFVTLGSRETISNTNEELEYVLPDGSIVNLAENASITYNRIGWWFIHRVTLDGDASFSVTEQKSKFSVIAKMGTIMVLGTKFTIEQHSENLHVACTEGSISLKTDVGTEIILKDQQINYNGLQMQISPIYPEYLEFSNATLNDVLAHIEQIYGIYVSNNGSCGSRLFSGWVSTKNIDEALEVIMGSCGINYFFSGNELIIK